LALGFSAFLGVLSQVWPREGATRRSAIRLASFILLLEHRASSYLQLVPLALQYKIINKLIYKRPLL
jgi:hypothetical protein